jgi:hypothetical protein
VDTSTVASRSLEDAIRAMDRWEIGPMRAWLEARLCDGELGVSVSDLAAVEASSWRTSQTGDLV